MLVMDGREPARKRLDSLKREIEEMERLQRWRPCLATIQIGQDPAAATYLRSQGKTCERIGLEARRFVFPADVSIEEVQELLLRLNADDDVDAVMVERPLPPRWELSGLIDCVDPVKDVEGVHRFNLGSLYLGDRNTPLPCTAKAILSLLGEYGFADLKGRNASVLGVSPTVGKAVAMLFLHRKASVTLLHSQSAETERLRALAQADLVVVGIGKPHVLSGEMLKQGVVVVDVGINVLSDGRLVGDVDWESLAGVARAATPVPGGIGPLTVASLMENVFHCARRRRGAPFSDGSFSS
ncbi:bifunctional 5,10-methylenetetrahydrofolate dehydrogenase/5,10-methenyltetrahydrofolate cyclohydrolase [Aminithiophilus ramosus]|uniref:Bifunctional protein FolD n=2 Tax=Aminithiophilus ramosus TaxID=3029084 RepID=A0A9Q7APB8_9BACT|nr:bifunctional 5,10-methylenetetrahydrofolate dehydrogenase/5,10-methenyltetrahydrofolate cyclohydrolase [Aminithiophilus ramosus]